MLDHIAGESGTQKAGAGADEDGVHLHRREPGGGEGAFGGLRGEPRRVPREAGVQRVVGRGGLLTGMVELHRLGSFGPDRFQSRRSR